MDEDDRKMMNAHVSLCQTQYGEAVRVKKKKSNDKFIGDVAPSVLGFVGDIVKSF